MESMVIPVGAARDRLAVVAAVVGPLVLCAVLAPFRDSLPAIDAVLLLVLVVVAVAAIGHRWAGVLAALSAAVWFDFFLVPPYGRFTIASHQDIWTTLLLFAVGAAVTEIAVRARQSAALANRQSGYLAGIRAASEAVSEGASSASVVQGVAEQLTRILGLRSCRFEPGTAGLGQPARLRNDGEIEWNHRVWDVRQQGLPTDVDIELVVESGGRLQGRFVMRAAPDMHPTLAQRQVAVTIANQIGAVFT